MVSSVASAQVSTEELARRLAGEGIEAAQERNWLVARDRFERAYKIQPHPLTLYNLATTQEKTGQLVEADRSYRLFLRDTSTGEHANFRKAASERRTALRKRIAYVVLEARNLAPSDILRLGQEEVAHAVLGNALAANPGAFELSVERGGVIILKRTYTLRSGTSRRIALNLPQLLAPPSEITPNPTLPAPKNGSAPVAATVPVAATEQRPDEQERGGGGLLSKAWFWLAIGAVAAGGAATGLYFGLRPEDPFDSSLDRITISGR